LTTVQAWPAPIAMGMRLAVQLVAPPPPLDWPAGQGVHTRSVVADGAFDTYVLGGHSVKAWQAGALAVALKLPGAQSVQTASLVLLPAAAT
jgi:hypothetical protein